MFSDPSLQSKFENIPPALQAIVTEFQDAFPEDRLEMMVDFSEGLPDLPAWLYDKRDKMEQVHECQSPVFLYTTLDGDGVQFYFDIPREAPTVRGYAGVLVEGLTGAMVDQVLAVPDDLYRLLGLHEAISHLRLRGLHAVLIYIKRQVAALGSN